MASAGGQYALTNKEETAKAYLPPTGSEERGVLGLGSSPLAIFPSYQDMKTIAL